MPKLAYLTIDDSPSKEFLNKINYLKKLKIPAIIFCVGKKIRNNEKSIISAIKKGFIIGNHSYNHIRFSTLTQKQIESEIKITDKIITSLYKKAKTKQKIKLFKFPFGDKGKNIKTTKTLLKKLNYQQPNFKNINYSFYKKYLKTKPLHTFWTFNIMEYRFNNPSNIKKRLNSKNWQLGIDIKEKGGYLSSKSNEIIVIHDHDRTTKLFYKIIHNLRNKITFSSYPFS